jgi:branched-chain amino acid transport system substrate-binding protein
MRKVAIAWLVMVLLAPFTIAHSAPRVLFLAYQGPLTGPEEEVGLGQSTAVEWAIKRFNSSQKDYEVRLFKADDKGDPSIAGPISTVVAGRSEILGIVGPAYSGATIASLPAYRGAGLAMISPTAVYIGLTDPSSSNFGGPVFFRLGTLSAQYAQVTAEYAIKGISAPKVFILDDQSPYGVSAIDSAKRFVQQARGAQLVGIDSLPESTADFSALLEKIRTANPNVIVYYGYQSLAVKALKAIRAAGFGAIFVGNDGIFFSDFPSQAGNASQGVKIVGVPGLADASPVNESRFRSDMGKASGLFAVGSIDATNVFLQGIKAGNTTRASLLRWIKSFKGTGIAGNLIQFTANGDVIEHGLAGYVVENQKIVFKELLGNIVATPTPTPTPTPSPIITPSKETTTNSNNGNTKAPLAPMNFRYSVTGKTMLLSAIVPTKIDAKATGAYLTTSALGISKTNRILGEIVNGSVNFFLDVNTAMQGKTIPVLIYLTNEIGESQPLKESVKIPSAGTKVVPKKLGLTVVCQKGNSLRTFTAKTCPAGWKKS